MTDFTGRVDTFAAASMSADTLTFTQLSAVSISIAVDIDSPLAIDALHTQAYITSFKADQVKGIISGVVTENATPVSGCVVRLHNRDISKNYVRETTTNGSGAYSFADVPTCTGGYYVVALDPAGGNNLNAVILDKVTI